MVVYVWKKIGEKEAAADSERGTLSRDLEIIEDIHCDSSR